MPLLQDIRADMLHGSTEEKLEAIVKQLNDWARLISNENKTRIIRSDLSNEAVKLGDIGDNEYGFSFSNGELTFMKITKNGILFSDETGTPRLILGTLPNGQVGFIISKEGVDVTTLV